MTISFALHHVALSVRDLAASRNFYERFGFREVATWSAPDGRLTVEHLALPNGPILELLCFASAHDVVPRAMGVGNDLPRPGVKHFGLAVTDAHQARQALTEAGASGATEVKLAGDPPVAYYFFVPDPDGNWVEVVQDERSY